MNRIHQSTALAAFLGMTMMAEEATHAANLADNSGAPGEPADAAAPAVVNGKEFSYFFKTPILKDDDGKEIGKGTKHPDVKVVVPMASIEDVINYLAAPDGTKEAKVRDYIMELLSDGVFAAGRRQINEFFEANPEKQFATTDMDLSKLTLQSIAEMPKGQRGSWTPDDDDFKSFNESYTNVLVHKTQYDPKKTKTHTDHWKQGMSKVKTNKPVVAKLKDFLTLYAANAEEADLEENKQTYDWLVARAKKYLEAVEKNHLDAL